jgi:glycosyltransferase involved in cell wall biosynthesis
MPNFGIVANEIYKPESNYDFYYIRNNPVAASMVPGPLLVMAYPYDKTTWNRAAALIVTTNSWKEMLLNDRVAGISLNHLSAMDYPVTLPKQNIPPVLLAGQYIERSFRPMSESKKTKEFRAKFGWGTNVGYIGRLDPTSFPTMAVEAIRELRELHPRLNLSFIGKSRDVEVPPWAIQSPSFEPASMPYLQNSFDCLLYDQDLTGNWFGSAKVLEAIGCEVPILARPYKARIEQLGHDYPLYYDTVEDVKTKLDRLINDPVFASQVRASLAKRREKFELERVSSVFWSQFDEVFSAD